MGGRHAVERGQLSWSEQHQQKAFDLPVSVLAGLAASRPVDDHPSSPGYRPPPRPRPRILTVAQFIAKMRAAHQLRWGWTCECGADRCVYLEALAQPDPVDRVRAARFMHWLESIHVRMAIGCSCGEPDCAVLCDLECVDRASLASVPTASHP